MILKHFVHNGTYSLQNVEILHDKNTNLYGALGNKADSPGGVTGK